MVKLFGDKDKNSSDFLSYHGDLAFKLILKLLLIFALEDNK